MQECASNTQHRRHVHRNHHQSNASACLHRHEVNATSHAKAWSNETEAFFGSADFFLGSQYAAKSECTALIMSHRKTRSSPTDA